ncbi:outer membrane protein assembly factor BamB family protein [Spirilliplanes yamanashiensis]|uniref:Pyrrolo-quinoline quinone repeat domain-containing protein n=1 Tax=Spirilliplanes yamanashiensis TaxID=42233 RepID=A0A8J3Y4B7_9ACTN|nr:PQQ-binding-like beta-propeller repeat protein [Spirilliplanes yamanashiensis]MDP9819932.1 outer membrane protein assembly factor BamB [Spirilliplanes yamanashiensis]GIJ01249.1 hypothetical protein Sya03_06010 [Spirilliplanes yamanashiensis]
MSVDAREPVIDLGTLAGDAPDDDAYPRPTWRSLLRPDRRVLAALVAAVCLLTVGASARVAPPRLRPVAVLDYQQNGTFDLTADSAYVVVGGERPTLSAYRLADGARRWSVPLEWPSAGVNARPEAGVVLVAGGDRVTIALDTATGAERWRQPGLLGALVGPAVVLADYSDADGTLTALRSVRLSDGAAVWQRPVRADDGWTIAADRVAGLPGRRDDARATRIVTVQSDGTITVLSLADGSVVTQGRVAWRAQSTRDTGFTEVNANGDALHVALHEPAGITLHAYDVDTLRPLWTRAGVPPGGPFACGAVLCMNDDTQIVAYDRATGEPRWRRPFLLHADPVAPGRLLASDGAENDSWSVLDDATGALVASLNVGTPVSGDPLLFVRSVREPRGHDSVSQLDPVTGRLHVLGSLPRFDADACKASGTYLVCPSPSPARGLRVVSVG